MSAGTLPGQRRTGLHRATLSNGGVVFALLCLNSWVGCGPPAADGTATNAAKDVEPVTQTDPAPVVFDGGVRPHHGKFVGNITQRQQIPSDFGDYWNQITPENEGKWGWVERNRDEMNWQGLDAIVQYAQQQGFPVKGHTLVWGDQSPAWLDALSESEQAAEVEEWIRLFCERFPSIDMIDVVNEPDHATPSFINALGGRGETGYDWVIWSFEKARQYCPNSVLILNDYNVLRYDTREFLNVAEILAQRGLLDAIGCQAHSLETQRFGELQTNLAWLSELGLPIYISEYDIDLADDEQQRAVMEQQFSLFYESEAVVGITLWGYITGQTWKPDSGLLRDGTPRPALNWLTDYLDLKQ